jgi:hypothetical protein
MRMGEAKQSTGLSERSIARYAAQGRVARRWSSEAPAGYLYSSDDLDKLVAGESSPADERDQLVDALVDALRAAQANAQESARIYHEPTRQLFELLSEENKAVRARCAVLEQGQTDLVKAREEALSEAHARNLAERTWANKEARWDAVFKTIGEASPMLLHQVMETVLAWKTPEAGFALKAFEQMADNVLETLLAKANLDDEAKVFINKILEKRRAANGAGGAVH